MKGRRRERIYINAGGPANGEPAARSRALFVLVCAIPMLAALLYGSTEIWAVGVLSLLAAVLLTLIAAEAFRSGRLSLSASPLQLPVLGLFVIGCLQLLPFGGGFDPATMSPAAASLSLDPYATRIFVIRLLGLLIFFAAALRVIDDRERHRRAVVAILIFGSLLAFFGILQRLASPDAIYGLRPTPHAIPFGPFVNQHHFAAMMEMTGGLAMGLLFGRGVKNDKRPLLIIAVLLMVVALVLTGSRGGLISFAAVAAFLFLWRQFDGPRERRLASGLGLPAALASAAVVMLAAGTVLFLGGGDQLARGLGVSGDQADLTSGRMHFWSIALKIFFENPFIGAGMDAFGVAFTRFDTLHGLYRVEQAHNDYLQLLADGGLLAFGCAAVFIWLLFRRGLENVRGAGDRTLRASMMGALAGCFGILIHSFFDFPLRTTSNAYLFLLLCALVVALPAKKRGVSEPG
jgi:O-antigen ligase